MRWRYIIFVVGLLTLSLALTMLPALMVGLYYRDGSAVPILISIIITAFCGSAMYLGFRGKTIASLNPREGMAIVSFSWIAVSAFGALPFFLGIESCTIADAFFESMSGFTTTGASILENIESTAKGILFWRSLIQWLGGMGIIVLSIAILPFLRVGGMQMYKAEVPSPVPDKLKPRIKETAAILWKVYILFSIIMVVLLLAGGMNLFESICHAFTTMPTGGFSTRNLSIAHYQSVYFDTVFIIFMTLAGINFTLHYQLLRGKTLAFWRDAECRFYLGLLLLLIAVVSFNLYGTVYDHIGASIRYSSFQVVSIITTTGFATADYLQWPAMSQLILLVCMFIGASAGSTGGGIKILRVILLFKYCYRELFSLIHPQSIAHIKIGGRRVPDDVIRSVIGFLALYVGLFVICSVLLAGLGVDFSTSFGAVAASIGNIGPGFGLVGPAGNYAGLPVMGKWLLAGCMLLGRLEIYTVIIFLVPEFWRK
ncbi:MAG: TrkH family potassium uptake protein [Deltaproteobacteria bacterium]|nr:TrkH family potassium uptake protein [Deltaproteobacteria bacterium]MBW2297255.1 TrkH family potassium uptake protein [Deltaproteobacteria bacterium]